MLHVLGPQRPDPNAPACLAGLGGTGPVVVLTAGWRHDETDDEALKRHLGPDVAVLPVYTWFEVVMRELPDLRLAYRARQDRQLALKRYHRMRLHPALEVVATLLGEDDGDPILQAEVGSAIGAVRELDRELLERCLAIEVAHPDVTRAWEHRPAVARLRERALDALRQARVVVITGGHVGVLRNRLAFFGLDTEMAALHAAGKPIMCWSAGSMVLTDRVVLFYDDPPDGPSHPELLDRGFGLLPDVVLLPHARRRLRLDDRLRIAVFAARFAPAELIGLENGSWIEHREGRWVNRGLPDTAMQLLPTGEVVTLPEAP